LLCTVWCKRVPKYMVIKWRTSCTLMYHSRTVPRQDLKLPHASNQPMDEGLSEHKLHNALRNLNNGRSR